MEKKKIGIIGSRGKYGTFWKTFFLERGHEVGLADFGGYRTSNEEIVRWADVVIISVTLLQTVPVIESLLPYFRREQLIMDMASTKVSSVEAMSKTCAEVVGLHPFCAPPTRVGTFKGQTIFVFRTRLDRWAPWVEAFLRSTEAVIVEESPEDHDRARTVDQMLEHMCSQLKVTVMRRLGLDPERLFAHASPPYRLSLAQMGRMFAQSPELYGGLAISNRFTAQTLQVFEQAFREYSEMIVEHPDISEYSEEFERNRRHIGGRIVEESFMLSEQLNGLMTDLLNQNSMLILMKADGPGFLEKIGALFREANISLTAFHSRQVGGKWEFFVAFERDLADSEAGNIRKKLADLGAQVL